MSEYAGKYEGKYEQAGRELGQLVDSKNSAYGNAFLKSGHFLSLLYPDGIDPEQYGDMLALVRIFDKMCRIARNNDPTGENAYLDLAGYGLLGAAARPKP